MNKSLHILLVASLMYTASTLWGKIAGGVCIAAAIVIVVLSEGVALPAVNALCEAGAPFFVACFHDDVTVRRVEGDRIVETIVQDVQVGQHVQTLIGGALRSTEVLHNLRIQEEVGFTTLEVMTSVGKPLRLSVTDTHNLIIVTNDTAKMVQAHNLRVGDVVRHVTTPRGNGSLAHEDAHVQRVHHMQGSHRNHLVTKHGTVLANGLLVSTVCDDDYWTHFPSMESATALHQQAWEALGDRPFSEAIQLSSYFSEQELRDSEGLLEDGIAKLISMDYDADNEVSKKEMIWFYRRMMNGVDPWKQLMNYDYYATVDFVTQDLYWKMLYPGSLEDAYPHDYQQAMAHRYGPRADEYGRAIGFPLINSDVFSNANYDSDGGGEVSASDLNPFLHWFSDDMFPIHISALTASKLQLQNILYPPSLVAVENASLVAVENASLVAAKQQLGDFSTQQLVAVENSVSFLDSIKHFLGTVVLYCCPIGACAVAASAVRRRQERDEQSHSLLLS